MGTPGFSPPEQYKGFSEPRSDLYSLGATMFCFPYGNRPRRPFPSPLQLRKNQGNYPNVSERTEKLISRLLEFDITKRPASAEEVLEMLRSGEDIPDPLPAPKREIPRAAMEEPLPSPKDRRKLPVTAIFITALAVFVTFLVFLHFFLGNGDKKPEKGTSTANSGIKATEVSLNDPVKNSGSGESPGGQPPVNWVTSLAFSPDGKGSWQVTMTVP